VQVHKHFENNPLFRGNNQGFRIWFIVSATESAR
jgi:hypothetical protein